MSWGEHTEGAVAMASAAFRRLVHVEMKPQMQRAAAHLGQRQQCRRGASRGCLLVARLPVVRISVSVKGATKSLRGLKKAREAGNRA